MALITLGANSGKGKVLQVVTGEVTTPVTISYPGSQATWSQTGLEATITPSSTSNKIFFILNVATSATNNSNGGVWRSIGGSGATLVNAGDISSDRTSGIGTTRADWDTNGVNNIASQFLDSPSTTSSVRYTFQVRNWTSAIVYLNRSVDDIDAKYTPRTKSTITLMEIAG